MTCSEASRHFSGSGGLATLSPELERHLEQCPRCRALSGLLASGVSEEPFPRAALLRVEAHILADLKPVRPLLSRHLFLLGFIGVFVVLTAIGAYRLGPLGWHHLTAMQRAGVFVSLASSAALLGFSLVLQMAPGSRYRLPPALLPAGVFVLLLLVMAGAFQFAREPHFFRAGIWCLRAGIPYGIPAPLIFWFLLRRGAGLSPRVTGMTAGALAGLVSVTVLEVHCPNFDVLHIVTFHLGLLAIGALAGLICGVAGEFLATRRSNTRHS